MPFSCECPKHWNVAPSTSLLGCSIQMLNSHYLQWYQELTRLQSAGQRADVDVLVSNLGQGFIGKKKAETFFEIYPCLSEVIENYVPPAPVLLALAERNLGVSVSANNMEQIRAEVEQIVSITRIRQHERKLRTVLAPYISGNQISGSIKDIFPLLRGEYIPFTVGLSNSNIVIAGRIHELIPRRALESAGLVYGQDFDTPPKSLKQGDIRVHNQSQKAQLATEVKSLAARERFKRGLEEIKGLKVGLGFFNDPTEFSTNGASALINQGVLAVYMPAQTVQALSPPLKVFLNSNQRSLFRPLSQYPQDMYNFVNVGTLP